MARIKKEPVEEPEQTEEQPKMIFEPVKELSEDVEITPLKDFPPGIHQNEIHIDNIKEGEPVTIPRQFLRNMVTEKVIKEIPK